MQFFLLSQGVIKTWRLIGQEEAVSQNIKPRNNREIATWVMAAAGGNSAVGVAIEPTVTLPINWQLGSIKWQWVQASMPIILHMANKAYGTRYTHIQVVIPHNVNVRAMFTLDPTPELFAQQALQRFVE
jgi:hypothetical protein